MSSTRFRLERMVCTWQHWFDFARGLAGAFYLKLVFAEAGGSGALGQPYYLAVIGGLLLLAVTLQTIQYNEIFYFTAPVFFLWGVTLAVADWIPALFAIVFSAIIARLTDSVELKLPLLGGLLGTVGYLVAGFSGMLLLAVVLAVLPVLIAFVFMHHLVCYSADLAVE